MKPRIRSILFMSVFIFLCQCVREPDHVEIPDTVFLSELIRLGVDHNGDGLIGPDEAAVVTSLDVSRISDDQCIIASLDGIEAFTNLKTLDCSNNQLTQLDVSKNTSLTGLFCGNNKLTSLNVSNNTLLESLSCDGNKK
jgi:Leucine-rich repeat (LRR) protein